MISYINYFPRNMKMKQFLLFCVLFVLVLLVSSTVDQTETSKGGNVDKTPEEYHVNNGYGGGSGGWGGYGGGGWGGPGGGGGWGGRGGYGGGDWGGYGGVDWGGYGGGGWGGPGGGGGWGGRGGGYGGGGSGGWGGGGGGWRGGCRFGCCGVWYRHGGCSRCCRSLTEAISFNEHEATP